MFFRIGVVPFGAVGLYQMKNAVSLQRRPVRRSLWSLGLVGDRVGKVGSRDSGKPKGRSPVGEALGEALGIEPP